MFLNFSIDKGFLFRLKYIKPFNSKLITELVEFIKASKIEENEKSSFLDKIKMNISEIENDFLFINLRSDILNLYIVDLLSQFGINLLY